MIKINFENLQTANPQLEKDDLNFTSLSPDMEKMLEIGGKYSEAENIIVIGRGGSVSTFRGFWHGLGKYISGKKVFILDTSDPAYIARVKDKCEPKNTVCIVISKSGNTVDVIENMLVFSDYPRVVITTIGENALYKIAKQQGLDVIPHLPVGGRFSGLTEVGLLPALMCGLDVNEIRSGAEEAYKALGAEGNICQQLAGGIAGQSAKGKSEIYMPIYSRQVFAFSELITQLIHESASKDKKGLTVLATEAPESQHHSNQRFFGGPDNMIGVFVTVNDFQNSAKIEVPEGLKGIEINNKSLQILDGVPISATMNFEFQGTFEDAKSKNIPVVNIQIEKVNEASLGYLVAFWQVFAIYLSRALGVNPFDQPQVESSKKISFEARESYKK